MELKIFNVTFNDGGWHQSLPSVTIIAENDKDAVIIARKENSRYSSWDCWASEFKIEGYTIIVKENNINL